MRNWKTTLIGAALAAVTFLATYQANGGNLADWKLWIIPVLAAALGYVAKDAGISGPMKILIASLCLLSLPSCADTTDPVEMAKRQRIVGLSQRGLDLLVKHQMMTKEDAALAQELGTLVINPPAPAKQPVSVQPPLTPHTQVRAGLILRDLRR